MEQVTCSHKTLKLSGNYRIHLSQKGKDFDEVIYIFTKIIKLSTWKSAKTGDIALFYCSLKHGDKVISKNNKSGSRWWMCLTNPVSDEVSKRLVQTQSK